MSFFIHSHNYGRDRESILLVWLFFKLTFSLYGRKKNLDLTKFKAFLEYRWYLKLMIKSIYDNIENFVKMGENNGHQHFFSPRYVFKRFRLGFRKM